MVGTTNESVPVAWPLTNIDQPGCQDTVAASLDAHILGSMY